MKICARVSNDAERHDVELQTGDRIHALAIPPKAGGLGSDANGGELLFLALATCYCNDLYREAAKLGIDVTGVEVEVEGEFGAEGEPAQRIAYRPRITSTASDADVRKLLLQTDRVAEIHNTLRGGVAVTLDLT
jgi:organic hydroperoxide reductase OsmC/OhrA